MKKNPLHQYKDKFLSVTPARLLKDISAGIIVALISIPISMGYAQVAGLPMQYGLYGSVFPILFYGLLTTTRDFVFGVDAAPAALVGGSIASLGIAAESEEAVTAVPTIAFLTACWLLLFYFLKAGKIVRYISEPVMGGFVTGICCSIILMQTPKLFGGTAGMGEAPELIKNIIEQIPDFNPLSLVLGLSTIALIMLGKKWIPKVPVSVIVMLIGALLTKFFSVDSFGVKLLPHVESGFPGFHIIPSVDSFGRLSDYLFAALSIAAVILSESLLASRGNALKDGYQLDNNREILAYSAANFAGALTGCCPTNGSVSRTGIVRQFGASSQWLSVSAAISMLGVLYFGTFMIEYLPVPVLTAIVISALINASEFHAAVRLWKTSRNEFYIFIAAMLGVIIFGTVYGVMIGVVLSFMAVIIRAVTPPRAFMGVIPGKEGFYSLERYASAKPVRNTIIYRFGGNLFFANIDTLQNDIEKAVTKDTKVIVINAGAVGNIDITAADRLVLMRSEYKKRGIKFYIAEHVGEVNDMLEKYGAGKLLRSGSVRMTTALALRAAGLKYPYPLEDGEKVPDRTAGKKSMRLVRSNHIAADRTSKGIQAELEWVFGKNAGNYKDKIAEELLKSLDTIELNDSELEEAEQQTYWGRINLFDEDELIDRLEMRIFSMRKTDPEKAKRLEDFLESRRMNIEKRMLEMDPHILLRLKDHRAKFENHLKNSDPIAYERLIMRRSDYIRRLKTKAPELAEKYEEAYTDIK